MLAKGTHAHEGNIIGRHKHIVSGHAWAIVYENAGFTTSWVGYASSSASAAKDPSDDIGIDGMYVIRVKVGKWGMSKIPKQKSNYFYGDFFEYVDDTIIQENTPTGVWAQGDGNAYGSEYDIYHYTLKGQENELWVKTYHDTHDPPWLDFAPDPGFLDAQLGKN